MMQFLCLQANKAPAAAVHTTTRAMHSTTAAMHPVQRATHLRGAATAASTQAAGFAAQSVSHSSSLLSLPSAATLLLSRSVSHRRPPPLTSVTPEVGHGEPLLAATDPNAVDEDQDPDELDEDDQGRLDIDDDQHERAAEEAEEEEEEEYDDDDEGMAEFADMDEDDIDVTAAAKAISPEDAMNLAIQRESLLKAYVRMATEDRMAVPREERLEIHQWLKASGRSLAEVEQSLGTTRHSRATPDQAQEDQAEEEIDDDEDEEDDLDVDEVSDEQDGSESLASRVEAKRLADAAKLAVPIEPARNTQTAGDVGQPDREEAMMSPEERELMSDYTQEIETIMEDEKPRPRPHPKRRRQVGEDFPGYVVSVHYKDDPIVGEIRKRLQDELDPYVEENDKDELNADGVQEAEDLEDDNEDDPDTEDTLDDVEQQPLSYHDEFDANDGFMLEDAREPTDAEVVEVLHVWNEIEGRTCQYIVGEGNEAPPSMWPPQERDFDDDADSSEAAKAEADPDDPDAKDSLGVEMPPTRQWLTWSRSWDDIRKYGDKPADHEVTEFLTEILGIPKPLGVPILPKVVHPREEEFEGVDKEAMMPSVEARRPSGSFSGRVRPSNYSRVATEPYEVLKTEAQWSQYVHAGQSPKTHFEEARRQYRVKMHQVRSAYYAEYRRIKQLHDENIQARWDQQKQIRAENDQDKAERRKRTILRMEQHYDRFAERRRRRRQISRMTRQNKEMKQRKHGIHMFNYILKERELHWIQPTLVPDETKPLVGGKPTMRVVHNPNLTAKLFERQEHVVGFWPKPQDQDQHERREEDIRRRMIKELS